MSSRPITAPLSKVLIIPKGGDQAASFLFVSHGAQDCDWRLVKLRLVSDTKYVLNAIKLPR